jgi:ABC-type phosphate transport system substrate-binding protein
MNLFNKTIPYLGLFILTFLLSSSTSKVNNFDEFTIIANLETDSRTMTKKEFTKIIYGQRQRWKSDTKVSIALVTPDHPLGEKTAELIYDMSSKELKSYWVKLGFQNQHPIARLLTSEQEVIEFVKKTPGAIGIVSSTAELEDHLKVTISE